MPPMWTEPASFGFLGSVTSYWRISPVPSKRHTETCRPSTGRCQLPAAAPRRSLAGAAATGPLPRTQERLSLFSRCGIFHPRATRSRSILRGLWCLPQRPGSRIRGRGREPDEPREPFDGWHRDRSSGHFAEPGDPRSGSDGRIYLTANPPARSRSRTAVATPTRSIPCSRAADSTRSHNAGFGGPRSISQRPGTSKVSQSMMKIPGGPSVPSLPLPPSVLT